MTRLTLLVVVLAVGCSASEAERVRELRAEHQEIERRLGPLRAEVAKLDAEKSSAAETVRRLSADATVLRAQKDGRGVHYILKVSIRQVSYSFDIGKQLRDAVNEEHFEIVTDRATYERATVGSDLFDSFRAGSAVFRGTLGTWRLRIEGKRTEVEK